MLARTARLERELARLATFFFTEVALVTEEEQEEEATTIAAAPPGAAAPPPSAAEAAEAAAEAEAAARGGAFCHGARYAEVASALQRCRGALAAARDARDVSKGICVLPSPVAVIPP